MGRARRGMRRVFALTLVLALGASALWLVAPSLVRAPESGDATIGPSPDPTTDPAALRVSEGAGSLSTARPEEPATGSDTTPGDAGTPASADAPLWLSPPSDGYVWPLAKAKITTYFAPSAAGSMVLGGKAIHNGLDLARPCWTPVGAAHRGTVLYAGRRAEPYLGFNSSVQPYYDQLARRKIANRALAIMVVIDDGNGLDSVYVHLAQAAVKKGDTVRAGETIGFVGATGFATGCHLHYSVFLAGGPWVPVAPELIKKWHYPAWMRLRIDPLLVLPLDSPDAAYPVAGLSPPRNPPHYEASKAPLGPPPDAEPADPY